jgi:hypothetical protein
LLGAAPEYWRLLRPRSAATQIRSLRRQEFPFVLAAAQRATRQTSSTLGRLSAEAVLKTAGCISRSQMLASEASGLVILIILSFGRIGLALGGGRRQPLVRLAYAKQKRSFRRRRCGLGLRPCRSGQLLPIFPASSHLVCFPRLRQNGGHSSLFRTSLGAER